MNADGGEGIVNLTELGGRRDPWLVGGSRFAEKNEQSILYSGRRQPRKLAFRYSRAPATLQPG